MFSLDILAELRQFYDNFWRVKEPVYGQEVEKCDFIELNVVEIVKG